MKQCLNCGCLYAGSPLSGRCPLCRSSFTTGHNTSLLDAKESLAALGRRIEALEKERAEENKPAPKVHMSPVSRLSQDEEIAFSYCIVGNACSDEWRRITLPWPFKTDNPTEAELEAFRVRFANLWAGD